MRATPPKDSHGHTTAGLGPPRLVPMLCHPPHWHRAVPGTAHPHPVPRSSPFRMGSKNVVSLAPTGQASRGETAVSEDSLALRFVDEFQGTYLFSPGLGWLRWDGTRWTRDVELRHFADARVICREGGDDMDATAGEARRRQSAKTVAAVITLARSDQRIVVLPDRFDADRALINTSAGLVDLRSGQLMRHCRDYVTKRTDIAPDFHAEARTWLRFLGDVFQGDEETIAFVRRLFGYFLTGETREQVVAFLHGEGSNGKSTLLDVVLGILGDYALKIPSSVLLSSRHQGVVWRSARRYQGEVLATDSGETRCVNPAGTDARERFLVMSVHAHAIRLQGKVFRLCSVQFAEQFGTLREIARGPPGAVTGVPLSAAREPASSL